MANVECPTHLENALHRAKYVTSVAIKIISVHIAGLRHQELGTESPIAHPEDIRAKLSHNVPGLEANR